ncbi:hypothetical protein C8F04DRAFT_1174076 [Mycena alexandri]|uniref:Transmembrane protein n=1 Tax=Mycena alexandri TaxID=1745969 RepID=A0AAD6TJN9_9AGAR|nr:hypothetical protein C8F04DRAFT_1174076 [Mycena alexandri]
MNVHPDNKALDSHNAIVFFMRSSRWSFAALAVFLSQFQSTLSAVSAKVASDGGIARIRGLKSPRDAFSNVSLSTSSSTSLSTLSDGEVLTTVVPVTLTFATLVPYLPSYTSYLPSQSAAATPKPASLPIIPIAAGGGGLVAIVLVVILYMLSRRRRRRKAIRHSTIKPLVRPDLDSEFPQPDRSNMASRTFSRLTFSAPYVVPPSTSNPSIAAPSTVSIGRQYRIAPIRGR